MDNKTYSRKRRQGFIGALVILGCFFSSCSDITEAYPSEDVVNLNFYPASDVLYAGQSEKYAGIYVDSLIENPQWVTAASYPSPFFYLNTASGEMQDFPRDRGYTTNNGAILYVSYPATAHQLLFADPVNAVLLDTLVSYAGGTYQNLYLTDKPEGGYQMLSVEEVRDFAPDGQIGVRFLHLSPDMGNAALDLQEPDGSSTAVWPDSLAYGHATDYLYFDDSKVKNSLIRFALSDKDGETVLTTGVPFTTGARYAVVIQGFRYDQERVVNTLQADNSIGQKTVSVSNNLRVVTRRGY